MDITELIKQGESETTEFKTSLAEWRDVVETISAFSNRDGGTVFIGVGDDCKIIGIDNGKGTIENLANQIKQNTDPVIHPEISAALLNDIFSVLYNSTAISVFSVGRTSNIVLNASSNNLSLLS